MILIEGQPLLSKGYLWIVKGYQHPPGHVIAYPRYELFNMRKARNPADSHVVEYMFWPCIKLSVPVIDPGNTYPFFTDKLLSSREARKYLSDILGVEDESIIPTGSSLITINPNDYDYVLTGMSREIIDVLRDLFKRKILKKISEGLIIREYFEKHLGETDLRTYLYIKKHTLLHFTYNGKHVNIKLVRYKRGYQYCKDKVLSRKPFRGMIEVIKQVEPIILPARFIVRYGHTQLSLETLREIYSELKPGKYYAIGELEERIDGLYLNIDRGQLFLAE